MGGAILGKKQSISFATQIQNLFKERRRLFKRQKSPRSKKAAVAHLERNDKEMRKDQVERRGNNRAEINKAIGKLRKNMNNKMVGPPDFKKSQSWLDKWSQIYNMMHRVSLKHSIVDGVPDTYYMHNIDCHRIQLKRDLGLDVELFKWKI